MAVADIKGERAFRLEETATTNADGANADFEGVLGELSVSDLNEWTGIIRGLLNTPIPIGRRRQPARIHHLTCLRLAMRMRKQGRKASSLGKRERGEVGSRPVLERV